MFHSTVLMRAYEALRDILGDIPEVRAYKDLALDQADVEEFRRLLRAGRYEAARTHLQKMMK